MKFMIQIITVLLKEVLKVLLFRMVRKFLQISSVKICQLLFPRPLQSVNPRIAV